MSKTAITLSLKILSIFILSHFNLSADTISWSSDKKIMQFDLEDLSGEVSFKENETRKRKNYSTHHFRNIVHKPTQTLLSPDDSSMKHVGFLNFFRVLIKGGYLTELRAEEPIVEPQKHGFKLTYNPTLRRQVKVMITFTFQDPNIIDMDLSVEALSDYPSFEILLSSYHSDGFDPGAYVAKDEFKTLEPEQIKIHYQPMLKSLYPFFPRDEAGANTLTDGRHQKGRWYWRMAIGRRYALPMVFYTKDNLDILLMGLSEDVYAVGTAYKRDDEPDGVSKHRSLYLSLFGEDLKAGESRRTQMRMVVDTSNSDQKKHFDHYQRFTSKVKSLPKTYYINPTQ